MRVGRGSVLDIGASTTGLADGGSNTDVGIEVDGPFADVNLNASTNVTGSAGDVRLPTTSIETYTNLATSPRSFADALTRIEKA